MICPFANFRVIGGNQGPAMEELYGLVVHVQVGDGSLQEWFSNPASQVSAHFWVGQRGELEQYVDTAVQAWAEVDGNPHYLSVETEGVPTEALSYAQEGTLAALMAWLHAFLEMPLALVDHGGRGITTHAHYPSGDPDPAWGGHPCPGPLRTLQLPKVLDAAQAIARPL